jgi:hypothetical protein
MGSLAHVVHAFRGLVHRVANKVRRPSAVTAAQHRHLVANPTCAACESRPGQAHHVRPFNAFPELGADPANFVTLCEGLGTKNCHLLLGHGGAFRFFNPDVLVHVAAFRRAKTGSAEEAVAAEARARRRRDTPEARGSA